MNEDSIASMIDVDPKTIFRTISPVIAELGAFSTALILYDTVYRLAQQEGAFQLAEKLSGYFPLFAEVVEGDLSPTEAELIIERRLEPVIEELRAFSSVVVVGIESVILDSLSRKLPGVQIYIISHFSTIDEERVLANFPSNVQLIGVREIMGLGGTRSVLLSYVFCQTQDDSFVYPVTFRAIGPDVRSSYSQIVGLNILTDYNRYLGDMAPLYSTSQFFTNQFRIV